MKEHLRTAAPSVIRCKVTTYFWFMQLFGKYFTLLVQFLLRIVHISEFYEASTARIRIQH